MITLQDYQRYTRLDKTEVKTIGTLGTEKEELVLRVCPSCGNARWNFQINKSKGVYHCWACNFAGIIKGFDRTTVHNKIKFTSVLPSKDNTKLGNDKLIRFLYARGLTQEDANRYRLYLGKDDWENRVICVLYEYGVPIYYVGRSIVIDEPLRYKNPKDIPIQTTVLWNRGEDVVLCEGIFDAYSIHKAGYNVIPCFGKVINSAVKSVLDKIIFRRIILLFDYDVKITTNMVKNMNSDIYVARLKESDPGDATIIEIQTAVSNAKKLNIRDVI